LSYYILQLLVKCDTKTKDNVFVSIDVAVQYQAMEAKVYDAFYKLTDPHQQIKAYVFDGTLPFLHSRLTLLHLQWCAQVCPRLRWTKFLKQRKRLLML